MTLDELHNFLLNSIAPALEKAWAERDVIEKREAETKRELEVMEKERDAEREARKKAEKESAAMGRENAALKKALEDERNKNKTNVRNTFGSKSRRSSTAVDGGVSKPDRNKAKSEFESSNPESVSDAAEASCIIRSLIETCKLWKKSVFEYVRYYFNAIVNGRTDYENLMPWCMPADC